MIETVIALILSTGALELFRDMMSKCCWQGTSVELVKVNQLYQVHELSCTIVEREVDLILVLNL